VWAVGFRQLSITNPATNPLLALHYTGNAWVEVSPTGTGALEGVWV